MNSSKAWFESTTLWFNVLAVIIGVAGSFGFADFTPEPWTGQAVIVVVAAINMALRFRTSLPIR